MGGGSSVAAAPSLKVEVKEAKLMQKQISTIGMSKEYFKLLAAAFSSLPSFGDGTAQNTYKDGTALAGDIRMMPQFAAVPLLSKVAWAYADPDGRLDLRRLLDMVIEWSDPVKGAPAASTGQKDPLPLEMDARFTKLFEAYDIDTTGTVTSKDFARIMHGLMGGAVPESTLLISAEKDLRLARGLSIAEFKDEIEISDFITKTTIFVW